MSNAGKWGSCSLQQSSFLLSYGLQCLFVHYLQVSDVSVLVMLPFWLPNSLTGRKIEVLKRIDAHLQKSSLISRFMIELSLKLSSGSIHEVFINANAVLFWSKDYLFGGAASFFFIFLFFSISCVWPVLNWTIPLCSYWCNLMFRFRMGPIKSS